MKRILLSSAVIVAFAGAAAADGHAAVSFGGDAELGYNDDFDAGMFWSFGLTVAGSATLDNGLTASISGDVELNNSNSTFDGNEVTIDDLVLGLSSDTASLTFGDTAPAADALWNSPVTNLDADDFNDEDDIGDDGVLIGRVTLGAAEVGVSYYVVDSNDTPDDDVTGLQVGANATFGTVDMSFGYQDDDNGNGEIYAIGASTTFAGATVGLGYASIDGGEESLGIQASYTFGSVTGTVFYVAQDINDDNYGVAVDYASGPVTLGARYHDGNDEEMAIDATYDVGNGLSLFGGYLDEMENSAGVDGSSYFYVGGDYDLGGGANLRVSYADIDTGAGDDLTRDELGAAEDVKEGTTVALTFEF